MIGDYDPEDAWDDGDAFSDKLAVLERVLVDLQHHNDDRTDARKQNALRLLDKLDRERRLFRRRIEELRRELEDV